jgi:hypothetical protein
MKHLMVSLSWQGDYWHTAPTEEEMRRSGHRYAQQGNLPHERYNFNFTTKVSDGYKVGFFQTKGVPREYDSGHGIVFFYSNNYIVGLYFYCVTFILVVVFPAAVPVLAVAAETRRSFGASDRCVLPRYAAALG